MEKEDEKTLDLLDNLSTYNLLLEQLQNSMSQGFCNLSRANYHNKDSLRGRYGRDYWDESHIGNKKVRIGKKDDLDTFDVVDYIQLPSDPDTAEDSDNELRDRKAKKVELTDKTHKKDPIAMFGHSLSIPYSLRESQKNFESIVPLLQELINTKQRLEQIINDGI